jgi:5-formyltetrahydrofolate cyclo-ligase
MCVASEKKYFRKVLTESRKTLAEAFVVAVSEAVQERLMRSGFYCEATTVVLYAAKDNEVGTDAILDDALSSGRRVLLPKIIPELHELSLVHVGDRAELGRSTLGLLEPAGAEIVPVSELGQALICVPGVAFSLVGQRLGRGGGYYDRLLADAGPQAITAGLAYSFQVLNRLPESPHDRRLDVIVTESAMHLAGGAPQPAIARTGQGGVPRCW